MNRRFSFESEKIFIILVSIIFLVLTFFVIKEIFALIIYSLILAFFLFPLYEYFNKKFENKRLASITTLFLITIFLFMPLILLTYFLGLSLLKLIWQYKEYILNPDVLNAKIYSFLENFTDSVVLSSFDFSEILNSLFLFIIDFSKEFIISIPMSLFNLFIVLFITYYALIYNKHMISSLNEYLPLTLKKQTEILKNISKNIKILFKGYFLTGLVQTIVAIIGYLLFCYYLADISISNILIISFLTLIVSLIPYLGTPLIWVPLSFYLIIIGNQFAGISLLMYGTFIISVIDNFLRPILMSDKETLPAPIVFIGFIGGMIAFGLQGLVLGPLIISITAIFLRYLKETFELKE